MMEKNLTPKYDFLQELEMDTLSPEEIMVFNFNRKISKCIVEQRKKCGMTQEDLAEKSGVSRITISAIEKRRRIVSTEVLLKLLHALNLTINIVEG